MAIELHDTDSFEGELDATTTQLEVETATADDFELLVDDTAGGTPTTYSATVEFYSTAVDAYMQADSVSGVQANNPDILTDCRGQRVRVTIDSDSNTEDYRVSLESFRET